MNVIQRLARGQSVPTSEVQSYFAQPALVSFFESRKMRLNPNRQIRNLIRAEFQYNSARQLRKLRNYLRSLG